LIEADHLPPERQDIWGMALQHTEDRVEDLVSLRPVIQTKMVVEDIEVYTQAVVGE
jgi:hypothetical protein